jgi:hypothetical protein
MIETMMNQEKEGSGGLEEVGVSIEMRDHLDVAEAEIG